MTKIGSVLARTFREVCEENNNRSRAEHYKISTKEIAHIEKMLKQVDKTNYDLKKALSNYFELEDEGER
jgi:hypothetical protein